MVGFIFILKIIIMVAIIIIFVIKIIDYMAGGGVPNILHQVSVPVIDNDSCQDMFVTSGKSSSLLLRASHVLLSLF